MSYKVLRPSLTTEVLERDLSSSLGFRGKQRKFFVFFPPFLEFVLTRKKHLRTRLLRFRVRAFSECKPIFMGDAAGMEGSSLAKIFVGGLDRSVDEVRLSKKMSRYISSSFFSLIAFVLALILNSSAWKVLYIQNVLTKF